MIFVAFIAKNVRWVVIGGALFFALYVINVFVDHAILKFEIDNLKATEAQNHERNETNETINNASDADKCKLLGGVYTNGQCQ
ncbi:hypothetical protein [Lentilitoribacter sp. Alg239-R112]|uniref:hypothetical protein n=1 Tax=Lentilitoribacter sp. Alg239-R112 TaxID=2305987 RepID=UPI0013A6AF63|nr:hypothetical protein [Lentilitoribacter sp. Alg239-R112]